MANPQTRDFYKTLGVPETATPEEIKKSYRKLAKRLHPDVNPGDKVKEARFKEITEAYETLGEEKKRAAYDAARRSPFGGAGPDMYGGAQGGAGPFGGFGGPFAGATGRRPRATPGGGPRSRVEVQDFNDLFGGGAAGKEKSANFTDMFSQFFGGAAEPAAAPPSRGADVKSRVEIDLPTAALGGSLPITVDGKHLSVKVPAGIEDGQTIRIAGQGQTGPGGTGDLLLEIHVHPHERFRRRGDDLDVDVHVEIDEAVLGGKVEVPTLEKPVTLTVPPGTSSGQKLRLKGKGARHRGSPDQRGDLYAVIQIRVPRDVPEAARELIAEFARLTRK